MAIRAHRANIVMEPVPAQAVVMPFVRAEDIGAWIEEPYPHNITNVSAARAEAEERAKNLFLSSLTPEQRECWETHGSITVVGSVGGVYTLSSNGVTPYHPTFNIIRDNVAYCIFIHDGPQASYPNSGMPNYDRFFAQKSLLEVNEELFIKVAHSAGVERFKH